MATTDSAVGAEITTTSARTLYWTLTTDATVTGTPAVAVLGPRHTPDNDTVWKDATWVGGETVTGVGTPDETHVRRLSALVAGPLGPVGGAPLVIAAAGEYSTWVRATTATDTVDVQANLLVVR